ncbi:MAG: NACHT domain-containing protein, partial [Pseudonocardiaceae bacterium]
STLARYVTLCLAGVGGTLETLTGHLPLLVELKRYIAAQDRGLCRTVLDFLHHLAETQGLGLDQGQLEPYLDSGAAALVVFDGLDEVFDPGRREEVTREIAGFAARYPQARVLVTSRIIGYKRGPLTDAGFAHYTLQDLDEQQISDFLTSWYSLALYDRPSEAEQGRTRLLTAVRESRSIGELAGNPLLLTILAIIGKHQELPRERWKVYDHAARVLVQHWDVNRQLRDKRVAADYIGEDDKREMLRRLAWSMQTTGTGTAGNFVHRDELQQSFEAYLIERYQRDRADAKAVASVMIEQFRERNFILSRYGPDLYGFVHRTFLEFFCADSVVQRFQRQQNLSLDELIALYGQRCHDASWREVLRLLASVLAEHHIGAILDHLLHVDRPWPVDEFEDQPPRGLALAVQCLAEVRNLRAIPEQAERVLAEFVLLLEHCVGIKDGTVTEIVATDMLSAARVIGTAWPGREILARWYRHRGSRLMQLPITAQAASLLVMLFTDRLDVLLLLRRLGEFDDHRATTAVIVAATELDRLPIDTAPLGPCADGDEDTDVGQDLAANRRELESLVRSGSVGHRVIAVVLLDRLAPQDQQDQQVERLLRDRLDHDESGDVFWAAAQALLRRYPADPAILDTIAERTEQHLGTRLAAAGAELLTQHLPTDPRAQTLATVMTSVESYDPLIDQDGIIAAMQGLTLLLPPPPSAANEGYRARHNALALLYRLTPEDLQLEHLLRDRLAHDNDEQVFWEAAEALLHRYPADPAILDTIAERTEQHLDIHLGDAGAELLTQHRSIDPRTQILVAVVDCTQFDDLLIDGAEITAAVQRLTALPESTTITALSSRAAHKRKRVRHNALVLLDRLAPENPHVAHLLRDRLNHDEDRDVFRAAAQALLRRYPADPTILDTIADRTEHHLGTDLGTAGAELLTQYRSTDPRTQTLAAVAASMEPYPLLINESKNTATVLINESQITARVQRLTALPETATAITALSAQATDDSYDGYSWVRHKALVLLDRLAPEDPQVEHLLRDWLNHDENRDVFRAAAQALLRRYPADPAILDTIADRTEHHLGTRLGAAGTELLIQYRPTDPRTRTYRAYWPKATREAISIHNHGLDDLPELTHPLWY